MNAFISIRLSSAIASREPRGPKRGLVCFSCKMEAWVRKHCGGSSGMGALATGSLSQMAQLLELTLDGTRTEVEPQLGRSANRISKQECKRSLYFLSSTTCGGATKSCLLSDPCWATILFSWLPRVLPTLIYGLSWPQRWLANCRCGADTAEIMHRAASAPTAVPIPFGQRGFNDNAMWMSKVTS